MGTAHRSLPLPVNVGSDSTSFYAHGRSGLQHILLVALTLMTPFVHTIVISLVICVIIFRLRDISTAVALSPTRTLCRRLRTRVRTAILSVAAGLLVNKTLGLVVRVTVTIYSRCTFLENR